MKKVYNFFTVILAIFIILLFVKVSHAEIPSLKGHVNDYAGVLTTQQILDLDKKLVDFEKTEGHPQVIVLTTPSIPNGDIEKYANDTFHAWKLGQKGSDNGVLLILAPNERKIRIEVGYGYEADLPDLKEMSIILTMKPFLKKGSENWYGSLDTATGGIISVISKNK